MIREAKREEAKQVAALATKIWTSDSVEELKQEFLEVIADENACCFIESIDNRIIGFAQAGLRHDYVEGTNSSPVGYLEGILVEKEFQHRGVAKKLLQACETWAKEKGCVEFASDCELENEESLQFHRAMGFEEANRIVCFQKKL